MKVLIIKSANRMLCYVCSVEQNHDVPHCTGIVMLCLNKASQSITMPVQ